MLTRSEFLEPLAAVRNDEVVVTCMSVVRPWGLLSDHALDFASADSAMGHTADLALGIALACPERRVVCLNGDGSMLMSLGTLATIVASGARNLLLFVVVNGTYEITGNQSVPGSETVDYAAMASAAGFPSAHHFEDPAVYRGAVGTLMSSDGLRFASVAVEPGSEGPISRSASERSRYLQTSLYDAARRLREALQTP